MTGRSIIGRFDLQLLQTSIEPTLAERNRDPINLYETTYVLKLTQMINLILILTLTFGKAEVIAACRPACWKTEHRVRRGVEKVTCNMVVAPNPPMTFRIQIIILRVDQRLESV
jgi:hypothetical protein